MLKFRLEKARSVADEKKAEQKANPSSESKNSCYNRRDNYNGDSRQNNRYNSNKMYTQNQHRHHNQHGHGHGSSHKSNRNQDPMVSDVMKRNYKHSNVDDEYDELAGPSNKLDVEENSKRFKKMFSIEKTDDSDNKFKVI